MAVEAVSLSAVGDVRDGLLADVLVEPLSWVTADLVLVLLLVALSSSSDEISTTIWADITGCRPLPGLAILSFAISQTLER